MDAWGGAEFIPHFGGKLGKVMSSTSTSQLSTLEQLKP